MTFVLDSSVALTWCFEAEHAPAAMALLHQIGKTGATAPQHWPLEALNGLMMAERRQRLDATRRQHLAIFLHDLPITLDQETTVQVWTTTQRLAARFRLTIHDAANLELAQRLTLPLATLDQELRSAGAALGVTMLGAG